MGVGKKFFALCGAMVLLMVQASGAQAGYASGGNCGSQYSTNLHSSTYSYLKHVHTYYPSSGSGVAYTYTTQHDFRTRSPYVSGSWNMSNSTPYESFEIARRYCYTRPQ